MVTQNYAELDRQLRELLGLAVAPIAITFADEVPAGIASFGGTTPAPTADGRTGAVPAGCVFWTKATDREFATTAGDHGNCSVGSYTHGFTTLSEAASKEDVQTLLSVGWVSETAAMGLPTVAKKPGSVIYGPLGQSSVDPDVVFLRINGKQLMFLNDAWPELRFEGKPQCHIIPVAKEQQQIVVSSGCMLSRTRTGMSNNEVTCAIPATRLRVLLANLARARNADNEVAAYAAEDAKRFA